MAQDYNGTLNLPQTDFPMRAGLPKREPLMLEAWDENKLYEKIVKNGEGKPRFVLHDGPPFSNGAIHMGHTLNKLIKDFIVRYKNISGWQAPYTPGWDNHGLPIESAIIKQTKLDRKKMSIPEFRKACAAFAEKYVDMQRTGFKRLGVLSDWNKPYKTMLPSFEANEVRIFGEMFKNGYIYKGLKPVYWCAHDETSLAEAEIEYKDVDVDSIYVKFRVLDDKGKLSQYGDVSKMYFVIWTTTSWTLPGNLAISVNPEFEYALAKTESGDVYIVAKELVDKIPIEFTETVAIIKGRELEYVTAKHPFFERESLVILGDHVTAEAGTGCVHTAPGHGMDDFIVCKKYGIEPIVPVDNRGIMTAEAGPFAGMHYSKANSAIVENLRESGALAALKRISHSYPHCWRCGEPILFRATEQWFCSVDSFKDAAVAAADSVEWLNDWGKDRMVAMIRERADWCISRQRHWGLPIPVFYCGDCGKPICTDETIEAVAKAFAEKGSDVWFGEEEILPTHFRCPHCGNPPEEGVPPKFIREKDTLDCWFDSGSSWFAAEYLRKADDVASLYIEGSDQYRGWFQSSLLTSVAMRGKAPYEAVLTNGWVLDGKGFSMHKSLGNVIDPNDLIAQFGADVVRLWVASVDYRSDVRVSMELFKQLSESYLKIRNTARYILGNLGGFSPDEALPFERLTTLDRWALVKLNELIEKVRGAYEKYEFHVVYHSIHNFCVVEMSNFYLDVLKDTLYCESGYRRASAQTAIWTILDSLVRMLSPLLAFTTEEIWASMPHKTAENHESVMLNDFPSAVHGAAADGVQWDKFFELRESVLKQMEILRADKIIGKSIDAELTLAEEFAQLGLSAEELKQYLNVSKAEFGTETAIRVSTAPKCPRCWLHSDAIGTPGHHEELCPRCAAELSVQNG
ncbi:MAG: isoleucine--tRNA ligase [Oscillospiraceae bacterium]|jgi:isoleucyl-tRNA synthetase|nr:isoleucine--tRNA ligase [Oscillospiraceae bacterium]